MLRSNQKLRTRQAILAAAVDLVREGQPPSVATAAERALVSTATAYRYFPSADDLWSEAALEATGFDASLDSIVATINAAGDDIEARLVAVVTSIGWQMIDDPVPFHHFAKAGINSWLAQVDVDPGERVPIRPGRRRLFNELVVEPLRGKIADGELERLIAGLGVGWGTEAAIALTDVAGLDAETAKQVMLDVSVAILRGFMANRQSGTSPVPARSRSAS